MPKSGTSGNKRRAPLSAAAQYKIDRGKGAEAARTCMDQMIAERAPCLLGWRVEAMIKAGRFSGFEVGFFNEIANAVCWGRRDIVANVR